MRFALTHEQQELRAVLRGFLADHDVTGESRSITEGHAAYSVSTWLAMAADLGLQGVDIPETLGGTGMSAVELAITLDELGASLYSGPFLPASGFAAGALLEAARPGSSERILEQLQLLTDGTVMTLAVPAPDGDRSPHASTITAHSTDSGWRLTGKVPVVLQADLAEDILVVATDGMGNALYAMKASDGRLEELPGLDLSRKVFGVALRDSPAERLAALTDGMILRMRLRSEVCLAAESLGGARRCLELATAYASRREQFGRPIGSFQAVKHRLADLLVEVELATSSVYLAACHLAAGDDRSAAVSARLALAMSTTTFARAARDSVQIHGGIAFTWEHDAHLYSRRAEVSRVLIGTVDEHLESVYRLTAAG